MKPHGEAASRMGRRTFDLDGGCRSARNFNTTCFKLVNGSAPPPKPKIPPAAQANASCAYAILVTRAWDLMSARDPRLWETLCRGIFAVGFL